jgi:hypothetical protein
MLPFLKHTKEASVAETDGKIKRKSDSEDVQEYDSLESAVSELYEAMKKDDVKAGCIALRSAFQILDSEPHEEGPHVE